MDVREGIPAVRNHGHEGDGTMQTVKAFRGNARTFLTHMFGRGLDDDRYVIERFLSKADGEIRPRRRNGALKKSRGNTSSEIVSLSTVKRSGPSATRSLSAPVSPSSVVFNIGGDRATGLFVNAKYR